MSHAQYTIHSSHGDLIVDTDGRVLSCDYSPDCCPEEGGCYISKVVSVDMDRYRATFGDEFDELDILDVDLKMNDGTIAPRVESHVEDGLYFMKYGLWPWETGEKPHPSERHE